MLQFLVTLNSLFTDRVERDDKGATMIEYGLMVALIAVIVAVTVGPLGIAIAGMFAGVTATLSQLRGSAPAAVRRPGLTRFTYRGARHGIEPTRPARGAADVATVRR